MSSSSASSSSTRNKRPRRGCVYELAKFLVEGKNAVCITGAGLSVASGVRPFRGNGGVWSSVVYSHGTRAAFRKNPLEWYTRFWLPHFVQPQQETSPRPNEGHEALQELLDMLPSLSVITQNMDGLQESSPRVIEAHGRLGLFKCIPDSDSDTDSDSDEDEDRLVHLGHRRKSRALRRAYHASIFTENANDNMCTRSSQRTTRHTRSPCRYELVDSIPLDQVQPPSVVEALLGKVPLSTPPQCPACGKPCPPQALLFDEGYHSHDLYQFEVCEELLSKAAILIFVGTSFQSGVRMTQVALEHARSCGVRVYNFNTVDVLQATSELNVQNVMGPAQETLPRLVEACRELLQEKTNETRVMTRSHRRNGRNRRANGRLGDWVR